MTQSEPGVVSEKSEGSVANSPNNLAMDDEKGNCKQCGHPFNPHTIIAYDVEDFSKGGEMTCPVDGCSCYSTISFDFSSK
jgi:hypothetical protein